MDGLYQELAAGYARGMLPDAGTAADTAELLTRARAAGLKLHRFKRTMDLPRVRAVLGILRGIGPQSLVDFGSGRGVFLWPLLDGFPHLPVTAVERDERRLGHLEAVRRHRAACGDERRYCCPAFHHAGVRQTDLYQPVGGLPVKIAN